MSLVDLGKRLLEAAKQGHTEEVRTLMSNGAPFTTDWLGTSPLHFSALNGHMSTAEVLLRAGISRDARTKVDRTPLHVASQEGHVQIVDLLIRNGADIEAKDMLKMSPLHWAVEKGHNQVVELLMANGSDTQSKNKFDKSSIDIAYSNGRTDIIETLQLARQNSNVEISTASQVLEDVTEVNEVQPEITIEEEVGENIITDSTVDSFVSTTEASKPGYYTIEGSNVISTTDVGESEVENGEQNSTAVLATLAALAEATSSRTPASTAGTTDAETLKWLESQGITMISADNSTLVASTLDNGQQLALTDAGKLALKHIVQDKEKGELVQEEVLQGLDPQQKVLTFVSDGELVETSEEQIDAAQMVVTLQPDGTYLQSEYMSDDGTGEPSLKRIKTEGAEGLILDAGDMQQKLAEAQKQAESYKEQLKQKEEEADMYKQQLTVTMKTEPGHSDQ